MDALIVDFGGAQRTFRLRLGDFIDLENARDVGFGSIYKRFVVTEYFTSDVKEVLLRGLIGGGMDFAEADKLVKQQFDYKPLAELANIAADVVIAAMTGIKPDDAAEDLDPAVKIDAGKLFHSLAQLGVAPQQVREMSYSDFVALMRAAGASEDQAPTEAEFEEIVRAWEEREQG